MCAPAVRALSERAGLKGVDVDDRALSPELRRFLEAQHVFFVATAPLEAAGRVNLSPKGLDTLRILAPTELAYLDLTGSGNETSAHLLENGRITLLACAFEGPPRILRIYGRGAVHLPGSRRWAALRPLFPSIEGARQIVTVAIERVKTSCGYGVPRLDFRQERDTLARWTAAKGPAGLVDYRAQNNARSLDGLPTHLGRDKNGGAHAGARRSAARRRAPRRARTRAAAAR